MRAMLAPDMVFLPTATTNIFPLPSITLVPEKDDDGLNIGDDNLSYEDFDESPAISL